MGYVLKVSDHLTSCVCGLDNIRPSVNVFACHRGNISTTWCLYMTWGYQCNAQTLVVSEIKARRGIETKNPTMCVRLYLACNSLNCGTTLLCHDHMHVACILWFRDIENKHKTKYTGTLLERNKTRGWDIIWDFLVIWERKSDDLQCVAPIYTAAQTYIRKEAERQR